MNNPVIVFSPSSIISFLGQTPETPLNYCVLLEILLLAWTFVWIWVSTGPTQVSFLHRYYDAHMWVALIGGLLLVAIGIGATWWYTASSWPHALKINIAISGIFYSLRALHIWSKRGMRVPPGAGFNPWNPWGRTSY